MPLFRCTAGWSPGRSSDGSTATETIVITVDRPEARILRFLGTPATLNPGEVATLGWETENAETVEISGIGAVRPSGSTTVSPTQTTTYTLTARDRFGRTVSTTATIQVVQPGLPRIIRALNAPSKVSTRAISPAFSHAANRCCSRAAASAWKRTTPSLRAPFTPASCGMATWAMFACAAAMTLGILSGGWRIVRTLGFAIYKVRPLHALDSQLTSAAVIFGASVGGAPVSTTHVVATSIMGVGYAERPKAVRWSKAGEIAATWVVTIPAAAITAMVVTLLLQAARAAPAALA